MSIGHQFRNSSIRFKLSLIVGISGGLALLLVGVFLLFYERTAWHEAAERQLRTQAGIVADGNVAALTFGDDKSARETLLALREDPTIIEAALYDSGNHLFASFERMPLEAARNTPPEKFGSIGLSAGDGYIAVARPVLLHGKPIGSVLLRKSTFEMEELKTRYVQVLGMLLPGALCIGLLFCTRLQRTITIPLAQLSTVARYVSVEKDFSIRAKAQGHDEVGILVDSFNEMLRQIESGQKALKAAVESARESEERFALAARGANDGLWDWKLSTHRMYMSPRGNQMFGGEEAEKFWDLRDWVSHIHPSDRSRVRQEWTEALRHGREEFVAEYRMRHTNGTSIWVLSRGRAVRNSQGTVVRIAGSLTDITNGKVADTLTTLHSRFYFLDRLESAIESGPLLPFAVLFLDLDRFKLVNDSLGHAAGDELLVEIARRLRMGVQGTVWAERSVVARLGGDEFAILLNGAGQDDAAVLAERILHQLSEPVHLGNRQMFPGVSIGIALRGSAATAEDLLRNADTAMYQAKQAGRGRIEIFDEKMRNRAMQRIEIESDLRQAIELQQLLLYYQPEVSVPAGNTTGFEALVRWQHPDRGLVAPADFITIAEETGLIIPLGRWVLGEACRQMVLWQRRFHLDPKPTISVNVSYKQLRDPNFVEDVARILEETGLEPQYLRLEMTESTIMTNAEEAADALRRLKAMRVGLEIDDFGTGYSSLSCLKRLPFDTVKIDRSFVHELGGRNDATEIVKAILDLAGSMTLTVVAEGVETGDQLRELSSLGCSYAQGYLFSKPLDAARAAGFLEDELVRREFGRIQAGMRAAEQASQLALPPPAMEAAEICD